MPGYWQRHGQLHSPARSYAQATAALILAVLWACWHLRAFTFRDTYIDTGSLGFPMLLISTILSAMIFSWLNNRTWVSLLTVILYHGSFNWLLISEAGGQMVAAIIKAPIIIWALFIPRRYGLKNACSMPGKSPKARALLSARFTFGP